ncbi:hypothetical protein [Rhizobium leguminosarum]|uniref:hypothetical protein n=1 Tax=Rhizobium leguminosarum TaxID=384 RepID=UPI00143F258A|nr:hypothetical protein [Rhizobium leguminosarum]NKL24784.1 hypothetical protein [Rhizobium leguminosarum bv. viciae]
MAQRKIDTRFSYTSSLGAFRGMVSSKIARGPDEDFVSTEYQRKNRIGPDYDPSYFDKLDALIEENYGPIVEYKIVNG